MSSNGRPRRGVTTRAPRQTASSRSGDALRGRRRTRAQFSRRPRAAAWMPLAALACAIAAGVVIGRVTSHWRQSGRAMIAHMAVTRQSG